MRRLSLACVLAAAALIAPAAAHAEQSAALSVSAELLNQPAGRPWAINLGVRAEVSTPDGGPPSPLKSIDLRFPHATINADGYPVCDPDLLQRDGRTACPKAAIVGRGTARADVRPLLPDPIPASLVAYVGPKVRGGRQLLFSAVVTQPVNLNLVIVGTLRETKGRYGNRLTMEVPTINTIPGSGPAAVDLFDVTVGGRRNGRSFLEAPRSCPRGGLPFAGAFGYADGSTSRTTATISCTLSSTPGK